ncbi:hypothetical protein [Plantactinospora endophytica]|uniref:Uncharacterized protein n=1 Tax=Plantactinospora endophytica TaxID=673535 RepID=A0ABQ4E6T5_9ACTN|nr:hypothetical protein [Plantactinospora endophytica]GIG90417.1 hypothetical protein Pen02_53530 [Plantactinospora endophytica]
MVSVAVALGLFVASPQAAQAESACNPSSKTFNIPNALDVEVTVLLCVRTASGGMVYATGLVEWNRGNIGNISDNTFENFILNLRLERDDADIRETACNVRTAINNYRDGQLGCTTAQAAKGKTTTWTADGNVVANIDNDGNGNSTWSLGGSPRI